MPLNIEAITNQEIAVGMVENPACWRLRDLAAEVPSNLAIVDLGAFKGRSTGWLAYGATLGNGAHIYSIDTWDQRPAKDWPKNSPSYVKTYSDPATEQAYQDHLDRTGIRDLVTPIKAYSIDAANDWKPNKRPKIGLLWHDAAHDYDEVLADLRAWLPLMADTATVVLHDVGNPNYEVAAAAEEAFKRRTKKWDWQGRSIDLWPKLPERRGTLTVHTVK